MGKLDQTRSLTFPRANSDEAIIWDTDSWTSVKGSYLHIMSFPILIDFYPVSTV